jgi:hypothetical protein
MQMKSFLHQTIQQLNWAFKTLETGSGSGSAISTRTAAGIRSEEEKSPTDTFNDIKSLIIKSADIVNAYYEQMSTRLEGDYVAQSDFGEYAEKTSQDIQANSENINSLYTNMQTLIADLEATVLTSAYIKSGLLYYDDSGIPVYGVEVGQRSEVDGVEVFDKYARFTSGRLSFYDHNGVEVAYISEYKLYITNVEITGSFKVGGYVDTISADGGVVTKWVGTGG